MSVACDAFPPLTAARIVCRACLGIDTLAPVVSSFLDPTLRFNLERAAALGDLRLVQRVIADHSRSGSQRFTHPYFVMHGFYKVLVLATRHDSDVQLLKCLLTFASTVVATCRRSVAAHGVVTHAIAEAVTRALEEAVVLGKFDVMQWLVTINSDIIWDAGIAEKSAKSGRLDVLQWLKRHCPRIVWAQQAASMAAAAGHLHVLQWLERECREARDDREFFYYALPAAAGVGDLATVQWVHETITPDVRRGYSETEALQRAIAHGHVAIATFCIEHDYHLAPRPFLQTMKAPLPFSFVQFVVAECAFNDMELALFVRASQDGHVDTVAWLLETHRDALEGTAERAMEVAAEFGHLAVVQLLYQQCAPADLTTSLTNAARSGHLSIVQWLVQTMRAEATALAQCQAPEETAVSYAAAHGHIDVAAWLHAQRANGDVLPQYDVTRAAATGQLDGVQWLLTHSRPSSPRHVAAAALTDRLATPIALGERTDDTLTAMDIAAEHGHLPVVQWFHAHATDGCTTKAMDLAAMNNHLAVVQWLHANRTEGCTTAAMDAVASLAMVQWLHEHRTEGCTTLAMDTAAGNGDFETLLFLHTHRSEGCTVNALLPAIENDESEIICWLIETYRDVMKPEAMRSFGEWNLEFLTRLLSGQSTLW